MNKNQEVRSPLKKIHWLLAILILLMLDQSYTYENEGRLHSQHRVYPSDVKTAPVHYYCDYGVKLCATDLKGYYVGCYEDDDDIPASKFYHSCKPGTRCGCQLNGKCNMDDPCIPIDTPYPMIKKATFRFNGTTKNWYYSKRGTPRTTRTIVGLVKQDVEEGKYLQIIDHQGYKAKSFELIVPNNRSGYIKYSGFSDPSSYPCKVKEMQTFEGFGSDIKNYLLTSVETKDGKTVQMWDYKLEVEWMSWITWNWKWVVEVDSHTQTAKPIRTQYFADGIEGWDELAYEEKQNVSWVTESLDAPWGDSVKWYTDLWTGQENTTDWFRLPDMCKQVKTNGGWSGWGPWTKCPSTCGLNRQQSRYRKCDNPLTGRGGKYCAGVAEETRQCRPLTVCPPVDGGWSPWDFWTRCSVSCGGGTQTTRRYCNSPIPQYGGKECTGNDYKTRKCQTFPCPPKGFVPLVVDMKMKCRTPCRGAGYCKSFCGAGGFCCKRGWGGCPNEARAVAPTHFTCIKYRKKPDCWVAASPGCVNGHNIGSIYRNTSLQQCKNLCSHNSRCLAFEYGAFWGGSSKIYKEGDCQLNNGTDSTGCDGEHNNLNLYIKSNC